MTGIPSASQTSRSSRRTVPARIPSPAVRKQPFSSVKKFVCEPSRSSPPSPASNSSFTSSLFSASSGALSATHEESFAAAFARGAPRTSTFTGGLGSGGNGAMWHATDPSAAGDPSAEANDLSAAGDPSVEPSQAAAPLVAEGHVTRIVTFSSSSRPYVEQYWRTAALTVASSFGRRLGALPMDARSDDRADGAGAAEPAWSLIIAAAEAAVRSTCVVHSKSRAARAHVRAVV
eukprot:CAMPEP_0181197976 /NCGR_PEP_ID=MMETSP1096-20121128/16350_1 /TAXON_ID=156174 ORGANISM="Chrysochromulina ericina, Strain CCMP281" /NCGR_SAMPLE_ID=MMETSP1096 /ASSEMBLY_ACC=CAM_ASM_000453 /LENGTH=232 /DNA_ID=CAMNT_0023287967 /DNA_START=726 /DNA_END=1424 /DNA_ORIENTATION=-